MSYLTFDTVGRPAVGELLTERLPEPLRELPTLLPPPRKNTAEELSEQFGPREKNKLLGGLNSDSVTINTGTNEQGIQSVKGVWLLDDPTSEGAPARTVLDRRVVDVVVEGAEDADDTIDLTSVRLENPGEDVTEALGYGGNDDFYFGPGNWSLRGGDGDDYFVQAREDIDSDHYIGTEISGGNGEDTIDINGALEDATLYESDGVIFVNGIKINNDVENFWFSDEKLTYEEVLEEISARKSQDLLAQFQVFS